MKLKILTNFKGKSKFSIDFIWFKMGGYWSRPWLQMVTKKLNI
jgi:hypothetical protein